MGKLTPGGNDLGETRDIEPLAAAGAVTAWYAPFGYFNAELSGTFTGSFVIERSFDGGTTAVALTQGGAAISFTGPSSELLENRERGTLFRWHCLTLTSGSAQARLSQ